MSLRLSLRHATRPLYFFLIISLVAWWSSHIVLVLTDRFMEELHELLCQGITVWWHTLVKVQEQITRQLLHHIVVLEIAHWGAHL